MKDTHLIEIRIPANLVRTIKDAVAYHCFRESVAFALASHARVQGKTLLLVRKVVTLPDEAYLRGSGHGAKWRGRAMLPILNEAIERKLGVVLFHTHSHPGPVCLSGDDRQGADRLLPVFQNLIPFRPHASVVFSEDHAAGMILLPDRTDYEEHVKIRWLGKVILEFPDQPDEASNAEEDESHHRQMLLIKSAGQKILRKATITVVGLGGGGSHVVQQLAHMGVGQIVGIDNDRADNTNRSRLVGLTWLDVFLRRRKIAVMRRLVQKIDRQVKFTGVPYALPHQEAIDALKESDLVVGCLDNLHARADLQELAWRYLIPYIDIGLLIQPIAGGDVVSIGGHVAMLIPGEFCQWCIDMLTDKKLNAEAGGRPRSYFHGTDAQAQVVSFNGILASQAVSEVLQLLTGFAPPDPQMSLKKFNGLEGTLEKWVVERNPRCNNCGSSLGAGDVVWERA
jgi:molybdopterin/thiamine biosynthesis adenylyltransferase